MIWINKDYWTIKTNKDYRTIKTNKDYWTIKTNKDYWTIKTNKDYWTIKTNKDYWTIKTAYITKGKCIPNFLCKGDFDCTSVQDLRLLNIVYTIADLSKVTPCINELLVHSI